MLLIILCAICIFFLLVYKPTYCLSVFNPTRRKKCTRVLSAHKVKRVNFNSHVSCSVKLDFSVFTAMRKTWRTLISSKERKLRIFLLKKKKKG